MRTILIFLTALALIIYCFFCLTHHIDIQQDVTNNITKSFVKQQMEWVDLSVNGRDVTLTGVAETKKSRYQAEKLANNILGVRSVDNQITLASLAAPSPYNFNLQYNGQILRLSGYVDNMDMRSLIIKEARRKFGAANIIDNLKVAPDAPNGWATTIHQNIFDKLPIFTSAVFSLNDTNLLVKGTLIEGKMIKPTKSDLHKAMNEEYHLTAELAVYKTTQPIRIDSSQNTVKSKAKTCQIAFNTALAKDNIYFTTASAELNMQASDVLEQLVRIAKSCPSAKIEIAGHTDSQGNDNSNLRLSEERAKSVVTFLTMSGINEAHLITMGYGETKPISTNKSAKGRAGNRRIEFTIKE